MSGPGFEPVTSRIQRWSANHSTVTLCSFFIVIFVLPFIIWHYITFTVQVNKLQNTKHLPKTMFFKIWTNFQFRQCSLKCIVNTSCFHMPLVLTKIKLQFQCQWFEILNLMKQYSMSVDQQIWPGLQVFTPSSKNGSCHLIDSGWYITMPPCSFIASTGWFNQNIG